MVRWLPSGTHLLDAPAEADALVLTHGFLETTELKYGMCVSSETLSISFFKFAG
jgi:hypothetical protein